MLRLFNTLSQKKEAFKPQNKNNITIYVCGITPYDTTHLGHAFTYISFDALIKYLFYKGYTVTYTQNVTDINDRDNDMLKRAEEEHTTWQALTEYWTKRFLDDMAALNWTKPTHYLYASQQIPSMIDLIQKILAQGYGYEKNGGVYLDVKKFKDYGKLSKLSHEEMMQLAKDFDEDIDNPNKKHPLDITLWRPTQLHQPQHIPSFDSPFGKGRPGWHIECSAMSLSTLAEKQTKSGTFYQTIDIHGGGIDLIYPHHESEIAQSESATDTIPFVQYWMHTGAVQKDHEKMSKSKGNLILVDDLLKKYSANAIRWYLLSHHYRESWNFEEKKLKEAEEIIEKLFSSSESIGRIEKKKEIVLDSARTKNSLISTFESFMDDDLDTPEVLRIIKEILQRKTLQITEKESLQSILQTLGFVFQTFN